MISAMANQLCTIFAQALTEVINVTAGLPMEISTEKSNSGLREISGALSVFGNKRGMVFISLSNKALRLLSAKIVGQPPTELDGPDLDDSLCELVNMAAGKAKHQMHLADDMLALSWPFVLKGVMTIAAKKRVSVVTKTLKRDDIEIDVVVVY